MSIHKNLADISFWVQLNKDIKFEKPTHDHPIRKWVNENLSGGNGSCLEIGCFPGRYLTIFGDLGYELNGIDQLKHTSTLLPEWLKNEGYKAGEFIEGDFLSYDWKDKKFDLVYSLGFIEHFTNWEEVIRSHCKIVKDGGMLLIEAPNFSGFFQHILHYLFDRENLKRHYIQSMSPKKWNKILVSEGFVVQYKGYFYGFDFWTEDQNRSKANQAILNFLMKVFYKIKPHIKFNSRFFSPYCGIIAKKIN